MFLVDSIVVVLVLYCPYYVYLPDISAILQFSKPGLPSIGTGLLLITKFDIIPIAPDAYKGYV